jgi:hypothetical protein
MRFYVHLFQKKKSIVLEQLINKTYDWPLGF